MIRRIDRTENRIFFTALLVGILVAIALADPLPVLVKLPCGLLAAAIVALA